MAMPISKSIYEKVAKVLKHKWDTQCGYCDCEPAVISEIRDDLARLFLADNPSFSVAKFNEACGIPEEW